MVANCPSWMHYCVDWKDWSPAILAIGMAAMLIALVFSVVLLVLYRKNTHKLVHMRQHYKIFVALIICTALRVPWWGMNVVKYENHSPPDVAQQMINRICLLTLYLSQSFYVQTWLRVIIALRQYRGENGLKWLFIIMDSVVSVLMGVEIIYREFDKAPESNKKIYKIGVYFIASCSLLTCVVYIVIGSVLLFKLRTYFRCNSKTIMGFVIISSLLSASALSRVICLFQDFIFGHHIKNSNIFASFAYLLPDSVPCICILVMQTMTYVVEYKKRQPLDNQNENEYVY
ncbi:Conserved_hypothetical protein [Hexamita inflata]|uniref:Uncharacterized protein n=1 Tax=Hexamita inflata TaxID=28002 RepID=A0AA86R6P8_9EUKA|nr:Conserved hypothetical protein [Hexamita inflata]